MPAFRRRYDCRYPLFHRLYSVVHGGDDSPQTCCASAAGAPLKREEEPGHRCAPLRLRRAPSRWRGQGARRCVNRRGAPGGPAIVLRPERRRYRWIGGRDIPCVLREACVQTRRIRVPVRMSRFPAAGLPILRFLTLFTCPLTLCHAPGGGYAERITGFRRTSRASPSARGLVARMCPACHNPCVDRAV